LPDITSIAASIPQMYGPVLGALVTARFLAAERLRGRTLVNSTTTSPEEARELDRWAAGHGSEGFARIVESIARPVAVGRS